MASDKENIADGLLGITGEAKSPLPARKSGRSRSKSIGPHSNLTVPINFDEAANRRKSAILPAVRSILSADDDVDAAKKRKEARRKSLANRRVSFAPEATLHTWDVIEYMRDANSTTSSSASSSNNSLNSSTRRSPSKSPQRGQDALRSSQSSPGHEPPSTPPEQVELEEEVAASSPESQREAHQKKRRRSSTAVQDDVYSSSPVTGSSSPATPSMEVESSDSESDDGIDETGTDMSMDLSEGDLSVQSATSGGTTHDSSGSSARLDEALRQAARQAGTQGIDYDENGDASMEMAADTVTNAFVPFVRGQELLEDARDAIDDKENVDPFVPATRAEAIRRLSHITEASEEDGMSMDITRAVGGILHSSGSSSEPMQSSEDGTMDFTMVMPGSGILNGAAAPAQANRRASLKRRRSSVAQITSTDETGSPAKKLATGRRQSLRSARRRSSLAQNGDEAGGEETMELTANLGAIQEEASQQLLQEQQQHTQRKSPEELVEDPPNDDDTTLGDAPMDMTMIVGGGLKQASAQPTIAAIEAKDEDLSMEFTTAFGSIASQARVQTQSAVQTTVESLVEVQAPQWKFPPSVSNSAVTTPQREAGSRPGSAVKAAASKSPKRRTSRKSLVPATPEAQKDSTPVGQSVKTLSAQSRKPLMSSIVPQVKSSPLVPIDQDQKAVAAQPAMIANTPIEAPPSSKKSPGLRVAEPSPTPTRTAKQLLPPPVRSPLAPKVDSSSNISAPTPKLSDSIRQLATPRKQMKTSPLRKVLAASTPRTIPKTQKENTPVKTRTPRKSLSPKKRVRMNEEDKENFDETQIREEQLSEEEDQARIPLQDFLNMTGIQFMDLRTTKRRHTGFPGAKAAAMSDEEEDESAGGDGMESLERTVIAATVTAPNIEMYRHSCQEMNNYISSGRNLVQEMDEGVLAETPQLFLEYMQAPAKERQIMDDQFRAMKGYARLESKGSWYQWRSQLLKDLTRGLDMRKSGMAEDDNKLMDLERDASSALNSLRSHKAQLDQTLGDLRRRRDERDSDKREELEEARGILGELNTTLAEKQAELDLLRQQVQEQSEAHEILQERKDEALGAIKEANRVREEYRGWSGEEVAALTAQVRDLEASSHWSVRDVSAATSAVTLSYRGEIELFFHPLAFADARSPTSSPAKGPLSNQPITLSYTAPDKRNGSAKEPSTSQRFFIQLIRAQLLALPQPKTSIATLLKLVSKSWDACAALVDGIAQLEATGMTDVAILGDEVVGVKTAVVLPDVASKVMIRFAVSVAVDVAEDGDHADVSTQVQSNVKVVYGERYDEAKMSEFMKGLVGEELLDRERMGVWADAVADLRARLIKRGRKG